MKHHSFLSPIVKNSAWVALLALTAVLSACNTTDCDSRTQAGKAPYAVSGRYDLGKDGKTITLGYSGARVRTRFTGTGISAVIRDDSGENYAVAWIDGKMGEKFRLNAKDGHYTLAANLSEGEHTAEVVRITECQFGLTHFEKFVPGKNGTILPWLNANNRKIEFIGDSITCGYGVEANDPALHFSAETENFCLDYSSLTARALNADYLVVSRSGIGILRNYDGPRDGSENTMPDVYPHSFYLQDKPDWDFARYTPDLVCINLGTNDFSTTGVNVDKFIETYVTFAQGILTRYPNAKLVLLQGPMNNSEDLKAALTAVLSQLQETAPGRVTYFELSEQGKVGLGADYHPNREQSKINAAELTKYLAELMEWR